MNSLYPKKIRYSSYQPSRMFFLPNKELGKAGARDTNGLGIIRRAPGIALDHLRFYGCRTLRRPLWRRKEVESHLKIEIYPFLEVDHQTMHTHTPYPPPQKKNKVLINLKPMAKADLCHVELLVGHK